MCVYSIGIYCLHVCNYCSLHGELVYMMVALVSGSYGNSKVAARNNATLTLRETQRNLYSSGFVLSNIDQIRPSTQPDGDFD